jgi:hypothetical protein
MLTFSDHRGRLVASVLIVEDEEQVRVLAESFLKGDKRYQLPRVIRLWRYSIAIKK